MINVEYVNGSWVSIYDNNFNITGYSISDSLLEFEAEVEEFNNDGFDLVGVEYAEGKLVGVFYEDDFNYTTYSVSSNTDEFLAKFEEHRAQGYDLIDFEQRDNNLYIGVYEHPNSETSGLDELQSDFLDFSFGLALL